MYVLNVLGLISLLACQLSYASNYTEYSVDCSIQQGRAYQSNVIAEKTVRGDFHTATHERSRRFQLSGNSEELGDFTLEVKYSFEPTEIDKGLVTYLDVKLKSDLLSFGDSGTGVWYYEDVDQVLARTASSVEIRGVRIGFKCELWDSSRRVN